MKSFKDLTQELSESTTKREPKIMAHWASGDHLYGATDDGLAPSGTHTMFIKHKGSPNGREYPVAKLHPHSDPAQFKVDRYLHKSEPYPHPKPNFNDGKIHYHVD